MAYDAIVCLIASGRLRAHSSCADTFFSLSWLNLCFQLRVTLMLRKTLVLNSGVMFSKLISQTCKGHSTKPDSVPPLFLPACGNANANAHLTIDQSIITENRSPSSKGGRMDGGVERSGRARACSMRGVRRANLERGEGRRGEGCFHAPFAPHLGHRNYCALNG